MYNEALAERPVKFIQKLKHSKGEWAGKNIDLMDWQKKIVSDIFGNVDEAGFRIIRNAYVEIPRKNGKTTLAAPVALYMLFSDGEPGAEIYSAAGDRDQAALVFNEAVSMIRQCPPLLSRCKIIESTKRIIRDNGSFYRVLSSESKTKHGFNASCVIFDELHVQPNRELWDVLTTSSGTRRQPLVFSITTAGYDRTSICWEQHEYARKVKDGIINDPTFYPVIYSIDPKDDWTDEKNWAIANPALGVFRNIEEMRMQCSRAKETPALQNTFRRLYLNQWTSQDERWLDLNKWIDSGGQVFQEDLQGDTCYCGLDLASTGDIAALVMVFPQPDKTIEVLCEFWCPEESIKKRNSSTLLYADWARQGLLTATEGDVIDYRWIRKRINELGEKYNIREIAFDRWGATELVQYLQDDGFTVYPFGQGFASMAHPTNELLKLVLAKRLRHGNHPVLNWMADNMVVRQDPAGNVKPDKQKSKEKIDGMVALIMALDRALKTGESVYEEHGIRFL